MDHHWPLGSLKRLFSDRLFHPGRLLHSNRLLLRPDRLPHLSPLLYPNWPHTN